MPAYVSTATLKHLRPNLYKNLGDDIAAKYTEKPIPRPADKKTGTAEHVKQVWYHFTGPSKYVQRVDKYLELRTKSDVLIYWLSHERLHLIRERCMRLFECTVDYNGCFPSMDNVYAQHVDCDFEGLLEDSERSRASVQTEALDLLRRLPKHAVPLPDFDYLRTPLQSKSASYPDQQMSGCLLPVWEQIEVAIAFSTNVVRFAIQSVWGRIGRVGPRTDSQDILDLTGELLEVASLLSSEIDIRAEQQRWLLVRIFLWTSWQRLVLLHLHGLLRLHLRGKGYELDMGHASIIRRTFPVHGMANEEVSLNLNSKPAYMCNWAFELLRTHESCIASDFRTFMQRYRSLFGDRPARCNSLSGSEDQCDGSRPDRCRRFISMSGVEVSARSYVRSSGFTPSQFKWTISSDYACV